jgi:hypothetical protein
MKYGISYNLFDGEELLEKSINTVRDSVDFISVVYQEVSNIGNKVDFEIKDFLTDLMERKLVDKIHLFKPKPHLSPHLNEVVKRNIGVLFSDENKCDYHMSMDTDEFYIKTEFEKLKRDIETKKPNATYCKLYTYYKSGSYRLSELEDYYVSLFFKIKNGMNYVVNAETPVLVDPTRKMFTNNSYIIYDNDEIYMHHMSYVRNNIRKKFENSSARINFNNYIDDAVNYFNNWKYPSDAMMIGSGVKYHKLIEVENKFDV